MNIRFKNLYDTTLVITKSKRHCNWDYIIGHTDTCAKVHICKQDFDRMFMMEREASHSYSTKILSAGYGNAQTEGQQFIKTIKQAT